MRESGVYLGFDFGVQYIGIAVGQAITGSASAVAVIKAKQGFPDWIEIDRLVAQWNACGFVVGMPYQLDGSEQPITVLARQFAEQLTERYHLAVHFIDERLTTRVAKLEMKQQNSSTRYPARLDSYAAKLILESWLHLPHEDQ